MICKKRGSLNSQGREASPVEATGDGFTTSREGATAFWGLLKRKSQREWRLAEKVLKDAFEWARERR